MPVLPHNPTQQAHADTPGRSAVEPFRPQTRDALLSLLATPSPLAPGESLVWLSLGSNLPSTTSVPPSAPDASGKPSAPPTPLTPTQLLLHALHALHPTCPVLALSSLWRTRPVGTPTQPQPDFFNAVALLRTTLPIEQLLTLTQHIEQQAGRLRDPLLPKGPRTLDLDLLLAVSTLSTVGTVATTSTLSAVSVTPRIPILRNTPTLRLPHPAMHLRRFVLAPLAELAPTLQHPLLHRTIAQLLQALDPADPENLPATVQRLDTPTWPALPTPPA